MLPRFVKDLTASGQWNHSQRTSVQRCFMLRFLIVESFHNPYICQIHFFLLFLRNLLQNGTSCTDHHFRSGLPVPTTTSGPDFRYNPKLPVWAYSTNHRRKQKENKQRNLNSEMLQKQQRTFEPIRSLIIAVTWAQVNKLQVNNLQINILIDHYLDLFTGDLTCVLVTWCWAPGKLTSNICD